MFLYCHGGDDVSRHNRLRDHYCHGGGGVSRHNRLRDHYCHGGDGSPGTTGSEIITVMVEMVFQAQQLAQRCAWCFITTSFVLTLLTSLYLAGFMESLSPLTSL